MSAAAAFFAQTYAEARGKFLAAAGAAGLALQSFPHPLIGRDGETLALDVARFGAPDASRLLIISSACHGVEGFCGSGVQNALLADPAWHEAAQRAGVALLYLHGLNPWGFSWWRRTTNENVDLNRNFSDFSKPLPENPDYDALASLVVPTQWPPGPEVEAGIAAFVAAHGERGLQAAISAGQYKYPDGLFYGGRGPTWSNHTLRQVLSQHGTRCARLGWIDLHTGLGPNGHGELIFAGPDDAGAVQRARRWWGPAVTSIYDGSSASARLTGMLFYAALDECAQAEYTGIALEYGTQPMTQVIGALRADQWLQGHPQAPEEQRQAIKRQMRDAFYTDTDVWKQQIVDQARNAAQQALAGLAGAAAG